MSLNQSRADRNENQNRKSGGGSRPTSSGQQRSFPGSTGGGGPATTAPPPFHGHQPSLATNRSSKKSNNGQGAHPRQGMSPVNMPESNTGTISRSVQNGIHSQQILQGSANDRGPPPTVAARQIDTPAQKSNRPAPRSPASQPSPVASNAALPTTPMKGDAPRGFHLQFGTISPGFMNGTQIPARTSSAPPNLDEQKHDQSRQDSVRAVSVTANPSTLKPYLPKKDVLSVDQMTIETKPDSKAKKESQVTSGPPPTQTQKPSVPSTAGIPMPMHFHQQSSMQFGGSNLQIPPQSMQGTSLPMVLPIALQMANTPQVQRPMYATGFHHHLMQPQGNIHQSQNLGFNPQMGPQLPHQLGNLGMNMPPPFNQLAGKFTSARKAVKITHPETHEELRLDKRTDVYGDSGSPALRQNPNLAQQTQAVPTYPPAPPIGYFANSYTGVPPFFQSANTLPLTSTPLSSGTQAPRYNYSVSPGQKNASFMNSSAANSFSTSKSGNSAHRPAESISSLHVRDLPDMVSSAQATLLPVTIKPAAGSAGERVTDTIGTEKGDSSKLVKLSVSSHVRKDSEMAQDNSSTELKPKKLSAFGDLTSTMPVTLSSISNNAVGVPSSALSNVIESKAETTLSTEPFLQNQKTGAKEHPDQWHQVDVESNTSSSNQDVDTSGIGQSESAGTEKTPSQATVSDGESLLDSVSRDSMTLHGTTEGEAGSSAEDDSKELVHVKSDYNDSTDVLLLGSVNTAEVDGKVDKDADRREPSGAETLDCVMKPTACHYEVERTLDTSGSDQVLPDVSDDGNTSTLHSSFNRNDSMNGESATKPGALDSETDPIPAITTHENLKHELEAMESARPPSSSGHVSIPTGASLELSRPKTALHGTKKKRKETLQKADAAGTTLDLYIAYKGPEEKKEASVPTETIEIISNSDLKQLPSETGHEESSMNQKSEPREAELDDWEDAADIPTPRLESTSDSGHKAVMSKKYTRDFLLTFSDLCSDLPHGFEITSDVAEIFIHPNVSVSGVSDRENLSARRIVDRQTVGPRLDRRGSGIMDADRWSKTPGPFPSPHDMGPDLAYGGNIMGFRPGHGGNYGVLRNPRAQAPIQYTGAILYGPVQSLGPQGGIQRNNPDSDRWQRGTNFQKGLMPPPQTPLQVMHKAEKKYEIGKVTDEEQAKQRKLKAILNKLTPQNFEKLFGQVKEVNIDNAVTLAGVISQIFDKALTEPTFCEMYANFCYHLASELPDLSVDEEKITFKRLLLNKCQEEFERGEREEQEANEAGGDGESRQSDEEREEKRLKARRRMLGNIRLIGELYKKKMLTEKIMHECIKKLLGQYQNPDEEDIEALCKLMSTIGEMIDHAKAKVHMDAYFDIMVKLSNNMKLSSRVRFMLKDAIDLRRNKWQQRRKVEGPKKIEEVHRDAAQERQAQTSRLNRGPSMNSSMRRGQPVDFSSRGFSVLPSPSGQASGFRGSLSQVRGYGVQDTRSEERNAVDKRTLSIPLPQRPFGDDSITLGPQGGLARGMSIRGQPSVPSLHVGDVSPGLGDSRRTTDGLNGYNSLSEHAPFNSREDNTRYPMERFGGSNAFDRPSNQEVRQRYSNRDQKDPDLTHDKPVPTLSSLPSQAMPPLQNSSSEECFRDMYIAAIKEFYSAKDEREVALCIRELNGPKLYPSVISIWVNDSLERRDKERDMLAKLIVNLTKHEDGMFTPAQLIEGFELVLASLEDTVNDAPKAAEFLGQIFAKVIVEKVVPLGDLGRLIYEGGEEPGRLLEVGLAGDVLGSTLEVIRSDKGEGTLDDILASSNLRLKDFRPPVPLKSKKLEMFVK